MHTAEMSVHPMTAHFSAPNEYFYEIISDLAQSYVGDEGEGEVRVRLG